VIGVYLWKTWKHSNGRLEQHVERDVGMKETSSALLGNVEFRFVHYLVENKILLDPTHILCSA
jgi:hypothetical protein